MELLRFFLSRVSRWLAITVALVILTYAISRQFAGTRWHDFLLGLITMGAIMVLVKIVRYTALFLRGLTHINQMAQRWQLSFRDVDEAIVRYHLGEFDQDYQGWSRERLLNWLQASRLSFQVFREAKTRLREQQAGDAGERSPEQIAQLFGRALLAVMRQYKKEYGDTPMVLEASGRYLTLGKFLDRATSNPLWFEEQAVTMYAIAQQAERHRL